MATADLPPQAVLREDLDPRRGECLVCYLDRLLARQDCGGALALARWWRDLRAPRATSLESRLTGLGAGCDCEVLTVLYEPRPALEARGGERWDRPRCAGVRSGSSQPCDRWTLRARWGSDAD